MWRRTQCPLALESFSFTLQNFFPHASGKYIDDDDDDCDDDGGGGSCDDGPCFGIECIYEEKLLSSLHCEQILQLRFLPPTAPSDLLMIFQELRDWAVLTYGKVKSSPNF